MKIILPKTIEDKIYEVIYSANNKETGGILMGEHIEESNYRIADITIQKAIGTFASFIREVTEIIKPLKMFFKLTNHNYTKYNYLGEWHSHPGMNLNPSVTDMKSMFEIVNDPRTNANFAVLIIFQINKNNGKLHGCATVYLPLGRVIRGELIYEG